MSPEQIYAVLLAGGEGTRFAPLSTPECPKQFLHIIDSTETLIQQTFKRIVPPIQKENVFVSTSQKYTSLIQKQLPQITLEKIISEPLKKNTAPAIALLNWILFNKNSDSVVLFIPSDQYIHHTDVFRQKIQEAFQFAAENDVLITFGIVPTFPSTDYGYVKSGKGQGLFKKVECFVEKPDINKAKEYVNHGSYLWNGGMFVWKTRVFLEALKKHLPELYTLVMGLQIDSSGFVHQEQIQIFFERAPSISVDYAVMEKANNVVVYPLDVGWSDVGTWEGLKNLVGHFNLKLPDKVREIFQSRD